MGVRKEELNTRVFLSEKRMKIKFQKKMAGVVSVSGSVSRGLEGMLRDYGLGLLSRVCSEHDLNIDEAVEKYLGGVSVGVKAGAVRKTKGVKKAKRVSVLLPFVGVVRDECCRGIKNAYGLHIQCEKGADGSDGVYCSKCQSEADKSASGKPKYGDIMDRLSCGLLEFRDANGKRTVPYANVVKKLGLSKEVCLAEAEKMGVVIPAEHWVLRVAKRGRPKKVVEVSDTESDGSSVKPKKVLRVKKSVKKESSTTDLLAAIMSTGDVSDSVSDSVSVKSKKSGRSRLSDEEKSKRAEAKAERAAVRAEKAVKRAADKAEKAAVRAEKAVKRAADKAEKAADKAEKAVKRAADKAVKAVKAAEKKAADKAEKAVKAAEKKAADKVMRENARALASSQQDAERLAKKEMAAVKKAEKEAKKAVKESKKAVKEAVKEAKKAEVVQFVKEATMEVAVAAEFSGAAAPELAAAAAAELSDAELSDAELMTEEDSDDDSVDVEEFEHDGVSYAKSSDNIVYTLEGMEVGLWDGSAIIPTIATTEALISDSEDDILDSESEDDMEF